MALRCLSDPVPSNSGMGLRGYLFCILGLWVLKVALCDNVACTPPAVRRGDPASIVCHFTDNVDEQHGAITVNNLDHKSGITILDCFWRPNNHTCYSAPGYQYNENIPSNLTLTILSVNERHTGRYICQRMPSPLGVIVPCTLTLLEEDNGVEEVCSTTTLAVTILSVVLAVVVVFCVIFFLKRKIMKRCTIRRTKKEQDPGEIMEQSTSLRMEKEEDPDESDSGKKREQCTIRRTKKEEPVVFISGGSSTNREILADYGRRLGFSVRLREPGIRDMLKAYVEEESIATDIPDDSQHIVLVIGKSGNGRSSVGNRLLDREDFITGCGMDSTTTEVQVSETNRFKVMDTPDISGTEYNDKQRIEAVSKWKKLADPGPHAILLTVRCDVRYTAEEYDIYKQLKTLWGNPESFCKRLVVVFTFGDRQDGSIEEVLKGSIPQELKNVLGDAGHRYIVFNKRAKPDDNKEAVNKLADIIWTIRQQNETERCLVVVGKTGNGRSSVGNTLLGKDEFQTGCGMSSTTTEPKAATSVQPKIKVVDTPDISDNDHFTNKQRKNQLSLWKQLAAPGPHAILLTVRCDVRYTAEEYDIYKQLKTLWGDSASFCKLLIVAFTFGDRQDGDIEEELKSPSLPDKLKSVLKDANGRYVVFNNKARHGLNGETVRKILYIVDRLSKTSSATGPRSWR